MRSFIFSAQRTEILLYIYLEDKKIGHISKNWLTMSEKYRIIMNAIFFKEKA